MSRSPLSTRLASTDTVCCVKSMTPRTSTRSFNTGGIAARAMPTITIRCGPGSSISTPRSSERNPCPPISSHDSRSVGPTTESPARGGRIASNAARARRALAPMSSGNSTSPALPSRSRVAIVCSSTDRLIPTTPPTRESWKPKPNWMPGVKPAEKTAAKDGAPAARRRLARAATSIVPRWRASAPLTPSGSTATEPSPRTGPASRCAARLLGVSGPTTMPGPVTSRGSASRSGELAMVSPRGPSDASSRTPSGSSQSAPAGSSGRFSRGTSASRKSSRRSRSVWVATRQRASAASSVAGAARAASSASAAASNSAIPGSAGAPSVVATASAYPRTEPAMRPPQSRTDAPAADGVVGRRQRQYRTPVAGDQAPQWPCRK